jgi:predicted TIM-barrel fold metal-dependent hydrolase
VVTKLTGQGTFVHRVDRELLSLVTATTLELFGSRRCMWGTNFPVESIWTDFAGLVGAWRDVLGDLPDDVRRDVWGATAERVYAL